MVRAALVAALLASACGDDSAVAGDGPMADGPPMDAAMPADASVDGAPPATLGDYWNGRARFALVRSYTLGSTGWPYGYGAGAHITIVDGVWYLFGRVLEANSPAYCPTPPNLGTQVRRSTDRGLTWSDAIEIIPTAAGTPWECAATDGDVHFDGTTWRYLFQCLARDGRWNGCVLERQAADPMGVFTVPAGVTNPVITGGALWSRICQASSADCVTIPGGPGRVHDEGTFNIFAHDASGFWVAFHGFDGQNGYRGLARTPDFVNWTAGDPAQGTPADAIYDRLDAVGWREGWLGNGPVGGGAGSILFDGGYWYSIVETGDVNLGCVDGQHWDWGMLRSADLTNTTWEQLPARNPFAYSSDLAERNGQSIACNPAYARLFRDPADGSIWLHMTRESVDPNFAGIFLYHLVPSDNLLDNGDLWKCTGEGWNQFPLGPTNLAVYRHPNDATDENCYLATNCGQSACQAGQSIYQDVAVQNVGGHLLRYGGKFATDSGTGELDLVVLELDATSAIVATHTTAVNASPTYAAFDGTGTLDARTTRLRYQLYLNAPVTFRADEMYLSVQF